MTEWMFTGPEGHLSIPVRGTLSSNSVETILAGVMDGVGIGLFLRASLVGVFETPDVITVIDEFLNEPRDVSLVWPKRRFVPTRVRCATDFLATARSEEQTSELQSLMRISYAVFCLKKKR